MHYATAVRAENRGSYAKAAIHFRKANAQIEARRTQWMADIQANNRNLRGQIDNLKQQQVVLSGTNDDLDGRLVTLQDKNTDLEDRLVSLQWTNDDLRESLQILLEVIAHDPARQARFNELLSSDPRVKTVLTRAVGASSILWASSAASTDSAMIGN